LEGGGIADAADDEVVVAAKVGFEETFSDAWRINRSRSQFRRQSQRLCFFVACILASWGSLKCFIGVQLDHVDARAKKQRMPTSSNTCDEHNGWCYVGHDEGEMAF
jgi:hypothetical protein